MKKLQKIIAAFLIALAAPLWTACTDYQDEIDALDYRITVLENLVKQMNTDLASMQVIVNVMETSDYITNVTHNDMGYIITFKNSEAIVIKDGVDGRDGRDGKDAQTPDISVQQDEDGFWYWTLNGVWITYPDGEKVRANGKDGRDGKDGKDGKDAVSPKVRINEETGIWEISIDGGVTWLTTGTSATGKDGKDGKDGEDGKDGQDGKDGKDGKDGNIFFTSITYEVNAEGEFMVIITKSGQTFRIPIYKNA